MLIEFGIVIVIANVIGVISFSVRLFLNLRNRRYVTRFRFRMLSVSAG